MPLICTDTQNKIKFESLDKNRNEFADEVLNYICRRKVTFQGCEPSHVEINLDGTVRVRFYGHKNGKAWVGGVKFSCIRPEDNIALADPAAVAELCEKGIALMNAS